jgi:hypothetical protein
MGAVGGLLGDSAGGLLGDGTGGLQEEAHWAEELPVCGLILV